MHFFESQSQFSPVMNSHADVGNARLTEDLLRFMQKRAAEGITRLLPDVQIYTIVLKALSKSETVDTTDQAEAILREMYSLHERGDYGKPIKPNTFTLVSVMNCYLKSNHPDAIRRVEALCDDILERSDEKGETDRSFNDYGLAALLQVYCQHGQPEKAEAIVEEAYNDFIAGKAPVEEFGIKLKTRTMVMMLNEWARLNHPERADAMLRRMRDLRDRGVVDDLFSLHYLTVADCWNRSDHPSAGERADGILQMLETDENVVRSKASAQKGFYLIVMKQLARSGKGERAESLLRRIQSIFHKKEKPNTEVDLFLYLEATQAWRQSEDPNATERIDALEMEMAEKFPKKFAASRGA